MIDTEFMTSDLYTATFLKTASVPLIKVAKNQYNRIYFIFEKTRDLDELLRIYSKSEVYSLSVRTFIKNLRDLKYLVVHPELIKEIIHDSL